jgi:hypothetical protein
MPSGFPVQLNESPDGVFRENALQRVPEAISRNSPRVRRPNTAVMKPIGCLLSGVPRRKEAPRERQSRLGRFLKMFT